jgi:hypothetical protein
MEGGLPKESMKSLPNIKIREVLGSPFQSSLLVYMADFRTMREEKGLEIRCLRRIFGRKKNAVTGGWIKLHTRSSVI